MPFVVFASYETSGTGLAVIASECINMPAVIITIRPSAGITFNIRTMPSWLQTKIFLFMKKIFQVLVMFLMVSCGKEVNFPDSQQPLQQTAKKSISPEQESMPCNIRVYNACYPEYVNLTGNMHVHLKETVRDKKYFIIYDINYQDIKGVGETSGLIYSGGGAIIGHVEAQYGPDRSSSVVTGRDLYKVRFTAPGTALVFTQDAHFTANRNGDVTVDFNQYSDSCR